MEPVYQIMEAILPFSWVRYDFMKNALLAVLVLTPLFGILGTLIVSNRMAFFSDALGHSALTGMGIGVLLGIADAGVAMVIFGICFALLLNWIKHRNTVSNDTVISVFSSLSTAIGLMILSRGGEFSKYSGLLLGDVLSITPGEILLLLGIFIAAMLFWGLCFNQLQEISISAELAKSRGIRTGWYENALAVLLALIVMCSIKWVGILIINALLILPAASARNLAANEREYHLFSLLISVFSGVSGLIFSYYNDVATGPTIVVVAAVFFFATLAVKPRVK
ncbi:MAG: metal ABC transporter permease [Lachnospiraceae bacterium]|jgi:zinc transport system permease protein|nr:metal ABC transporter permease [Lachnospiraceae bacterium]